MCNEFLQIFILIADVYLMGSKCCTPFDHLTAKVGTVSGLFQPYFYVHAHCKWYSAGGTGEYDGPVLQQSVVES